MSFVRHPRYPIAPTRAPEARKLNYLEYVLTDYDSVKEVKLFGLGEPLLGRYADLFWKFLREGLRRGNDCAGRGEHRSEFD